MSGSVRKGVLFEVGPDGYGYILDRSDPDLALSYAFHTSMLATADLSNLEKPVLLEGRCVYFQVVEGLPVNVRLSNAMAAGA